MRINVLQPNPNDNRHVEREHQPIIKIRIRDDGNLANATSKSQGIEGGVSLRDPYGKSGPIHAAPGEIHSVREEDARQLVQARRAEYLTEADRQAHDAIYFPKV